MRVIRIMDSIDDKMTARFFEEIAELEACGNTADRIVIELSSGGGIAYEALAIASRIRLSPCPIHIKAYGLVASAAVLILAYGDYRMMASEAWVMVHEDSGKQSGSISVLERKISHDRAMEQQWCDLLAAVTPKTSSDTWTTLHKEETHLTADECLELGLIDEVV